MDYDSRDDTNQHIHEVWINMRRLTYELEQRANLHDRSKLGPHEKPIFDRITPLLKELTYGSEAYKANLKLLGPALSHHYVVNSHHPEHYLDGVAGMNLLDLVEMFCDWRAATMRHHDGSLAKSVEINIERFKIEPMLAQILRNSISIFEGA